MVRHHYSFTAERSILTVLKENYIIFVSNVPKKRSKLVWFEIFIFFLIDTCDFRLPEQIIQSSEQSPSYSYSFLGRHIVLNL